MTEDNKVFFIIFALILLAGAFLTIRTIDRSNCKNLICVEGKTCCCYDKYCQEWSEDGKECVLWDKYFENLREAHYET